MDKKRKSLWRKIVATVVVVMPVMPVLYILDKLVWMAFIRPIFSP